MSNHIEKRVLRSSSGRAGVAIITRTKNRPRMLARAVRSVLGQSCEDWLHVIVNDGGDLAKVRAVVSEYTAEYAGRLEVIHAESSLGMECASNIGIRSVDSDFVLIHDDDDTLEANFLEVCVNYLKEHQYSSIAGVVTMTSVIYEQMEGEIAREVKKEKYRDLSSCIDIGQMAIVNQFPPISFLYHRAVYEELNGYNEALSVLGDWEFNLRFLLRYNIGVIPQRLANYHQRPMEKYGDLGNSLFADQQRHVFYDTLIRNEFFQSRTDPAKRTLGQMMILTKMVERWERRHRVRVVFDLIYRLPGVTWMVREARRRGYLINRTRNA